MYLSELFYACLFSVIHAVYVSQNSILSFAYLRADVPITKLYRNAGNVNHFSPFPSRCTAVTHLLARFGQHRLYGKMRSHNGAVIERAAARHVRMYNIDT